MGAGIRQVADGGIGVILDGGGDNVYEFDYLSHGGGYWCGLGFARDFGGNTKRLICRKAYNGGPRTEPSFQRFGCGWGCHYALGFCFDDGGDDVYEGTIMGTGMAWDCSMGVLCDFGRQRPLQGHRRPDPGHRRPGQLRHPLRLRRRRRVRGLRPGLRLARASRYHHLPDCGGNFSFLVDYGGKDKYGCGADNYTLIQRGDAAAS